MVGEFDSSHFFLIYRILGLILISLFFFSLEDSRDPTDNYRVSGVRCGKLGTGGAEKLALLGLGLCGADREARKSIREIHSLNSTHGIGLLVTSALPYKANSKEENRHSRRQSINRVTSRMGRGNMGRWVSRPLSARCPLPAARCLRKRETGLDDGMFTSWTLRYHRGKDTEFGNALPPPWSGVQEDVSVIVLYCTCLPPRWN